MILSVVKIAEIHRTLVGWETAKCKR